jgi:hypothetical protein
MRPIFLAGLAAVVAAPLLCRAQPSEAQRQIERALIERDRQAEEFARPEVRNMPQPSPAEPLRPDERVLRQREREAYELGLPPKPPVKAPLAEKPLALPGGPGHAVNPVPVPRPRSERRVERGKACVRDVPGIDLEKRP